MDESETIERSLVLHTVQLFHLLGLDLLVVTVQSEALSAAVQWAASVRRTNPITSQASMSSRVRFYGHRKGMQSISKLLTRRTQKLGTTHMKVSSFEEEECPIPLLPNTTTTQVSADS